MPFHTKSEKLTLQDIMNARRAGHLTTRQFTDLFGEIQNLGEGATLTSEEVSIIMGGGQIDRRGFIERTFGGITSTDPAEQGTFIRPGFNIPGTDIGVNIPTLATGVTLASLGLGAPATGATIVGGSQGLGLGLAARTAGAAALKRAPLAAGLGIVAGGAGALTGTGQQDVPQPPPVGAPTEEVPSTDAAAQAVQEDLANQPILPTGDDEEPPFKPPFTEVDVTDDDGNPTGTTVFIDATGRPVPPNAFNIPREVAETNANFFNTPRGRVFQAELDRREAETDARAREDAARLASGRLSVQQERQRQFSARESLAQRETLAEQNRLQREAQLVNTLLPLLSQPGSRFALQANLIRSGSGQLPGGLEGLFGGGQFSAGVSPVGGNRQAQFTPTEALGRLFRFTGRQPGQAVPLTGEQVPSIAPNIQQFADLGPGQREELEAIIQQTTGRDLRSFGRAARRGFQ